MRSTASSVPRRVLSTAGLPTIARALPSNALAIGLPIVFPRRAASLWSINGKRACPLLRREGRGPRTSYEAKDTASIRTTSGRISAYDLGEGDGFGGTCGRCNGRGRCGHEGFTDAAVSAALLGLKPAARSAGRCFAVAAPRSPALAAGVSAAGRPPAHLP